MNKIMKKFKISKSYLIPIVLGVILFLLVSFWVYHEMKIFRDRTQRIINQEGEITTKAIKGIIQSQMVAGRIAKGRLEFILSNIVDQTILKYVCIKKNKKIIFVSENHDSEYKAYSVNNKKNKSIYFFSGKINLQVSPPPFLGHHRIMIPGNKYKMYAERIANDIRAKRDFEKHPEEFIDFSHSTQKIIVGIDISIFKKQLHAELRKTLIFYIISCIAITVWIFAWIYMLKNSRLKIKYAEIKTKTDKLEELSLAATGLAHEVKNPLGIIRGLTQEILQNSSNKDFVTDIAEKIIDESDIAAERLSDFMNYAKHKIPRLSVIELENYFYEITDMLHYEINEKELILKTEIKKLKIKADREFLDQIIVNIIVNSINACANGNYIKVRTEIVKDNICSIEISDNGSGIQEHLMKNIFKPYISGNPKGHGIGLAIVKKLVDELNWEIKMESRPGIGTKTIISNIIYVI